MNVYVLLYSDIIYALMLSQTFIVQSIESVADCTCEHIIPQAQTGLQYHHTIAPPVLNTNPWQN